VVLLLLSAFHALARHPNSLVDPACELSISMTIRRSMPGRCVELGRVRLCWWPCWPCAVARLAAAWRAARPSYPEHDPVLLSQGSVSIDGLDFPEIAADTVGRGYAGLLGSKTALPAVRTATPDATATAMSTVDPASAMAILDGFLYRFLSWDHVRKGAKRTFGRARGYALGFHPGALPVAWKARPGSSVQM